MLDGGKFALIAIALPGSSALGQSKASPGYPDRTIKIIAPVQPGGGVDLVARTVADRPGPALGLPIVVDNQSGGGGFVGALATARAAPDGYTSMIGYVGTHGTDPAVRKLRTMRAGPWPTRQTSNRSGPRRPA